MPRGYTKSGKTKHFPYTTAGKRAAKASMKYRKMSSHKKKSSHKRKMK